MLTTCRHCGKGRVAGAVTCLSCSNYYPYPDLVGYESLSYFLEQIEKEQWKKAIQAEKRAELLRPYHNQRYGIGLRLGLERPTEPKLRDLKYSTAVFLTKDLTESENLPEALTQAEKAALLSYIGKQKELLELEYHYLVAFLPNHNNLTIKREIVHCSLQLLEVARSKELVSTEALSQLQSRYNQQVEELDKQATAQNSQWQVPTPPWPILGANKAPVKAKVKKIVPLAPAPKPRREFKWEYVWSALLSETTLHALLYLGALFIMVAATLFITLNWNKFPAFLQASFLMLADLAFFGAGLAVLKFMKLKKSGMALTAVSAAILPLVIYGYSRPELVNLDNRGTWTWVSLLILPGYLLLTWFLRERIFSILCTLASLNALLALLNQFRIEPEWLLVATLPFAALLVWIDRKLRANQNFGELAGPPFWVGQVLAALIPLLLLSYSTTLSINGPAPDASLQYAVGAAWWLATVYYAWCAATSKAEMYLYHYGSAFAGVIAVALTLHKFSALELWYWPTIGLVGAGYMAGQSLIDLIDHLNFNHNATPWRSSEVFAGRKPFNNIGAAMIFSSLILASTHHQLGWALLVLAGVLAAGSVLYHWDELIYGSVLSSIAGILLVVPLELEFNSLILVGLALLYFGLSLWLAPLLARGETKSGPLTYPLLAGGLVLAGMALFVARYHNWHVLIVTLALLVTSGYATHRFKNWNFNWLASGLTLWLAWNSYLVVNPNPHWQLEGLSVALLAIVLAIIGLGLGEDYGRPFYWTAQPVAAISILVALNAGLFVNDLLALSPQLLALLLLVALYGILTIRESQFWYIYGLAVPLSLALVLVARILRYQLSEDITLAFGYFGMAVLAAGLYPYSQKFSQNRYTLADFRPQAALSHLSHAWALVGLGLAYYNYPVVYALALVALYAGRSWHERRAELQVIVVIGGIYSLTRFIGTSSQSTRQLALALLGLAVVYILIGRWFKGRLGRESRFDYRFATNLFNYIGQGLIFLGVGPVLRSNDYGYITFTLTAAVMVSVWLAFTERIEWSFAALLMGLGAYTSGYYLLGINWYWFGLALFIPIIGLTAIGLRLLNYRLPLIGLGAVRANSTLQEKIGESFCVTAGALGLFGLCFSLLRTETMLAHLMVISLFSLAFLRTSRLIGWLYLALPSSLYAYWLGLSLLEVGQSYTGLALLPLAGLYLAGMFYLTYRGLWLEDAARLAGKWVLALAAQGVGLTTLNFSLTNHLMLTLNLAALTLIYLGILSSTRYKLWLYPLIISAHLTYLGLLSLIIAAGSNLSNAQVGLALLPIGLVALVAATGRGVKTGQNLGTIAVQLGQDTDFLKNISRTSLLFYLIGAIDLGLSLAFTAPQTEVAVLVAVLITLCLFTISFWEGLELLAWATLAMALLTTYFFGQLIPTPPQVLTITLATTAIVATLISYLIGRGRSHIWLRPTRFSSHGLVFCAAVAWLVVSSSRLSNDLVLDSLSWLLGLVGVNYLLVSTLQSRTKSAPSDLLRYLGYGGVMLVETAFILRLALVSVSQPQFYVIPVGLTCLILAWIERGHQNQRTAPLLEALGLIILLGTSLFQSFDFQTGANTANLYGIWLIIEAVLTLGFGAANRLRYYFFGGITALLLDVISLSIDPIRAADKWVVLGVTGLFLVMVALLLERKREAVILLSKEWVHRLKEWQ